MTTEEILKQAADLTFITSAKQANSLLSDLNTILAGMRLDVTELELEQELAFDRLYDQVRAEGKTEMYAKNKHHISEVYRNWKRKKGTLADVRAVRKTLTAHAEILSSQERFGRNYEGRAYLS